MNPWLNPFYLKMLIDLAEINYAHAVLSGDIKAMRESAIFYQIVAGQMVQNISNSL